MKTVRRSIALPKTEGTELKVSRPEMFATFRWLLEGWLSTPCVDIGPVSEWPAQMALERMVIFSGGAKGCLVLRAPKSLGEALWEKTAGERAEGAKESPEELFGGLAALYFSYLATQLWEGKAESLKVYQPAASDPAMWPQSSPRTAFTVLVGTIPLEIRIWIQERG